MLCLCFTEKLFAQYILSGRITDSKNTPLAFASIIASSQKHTRNITFSISNEKGLYELKNLPPDSLIIEVSSMGFESQKIELYVQKSDTINFILKKIAIELSEVIISAKKDIKQSKDTITYNASSFRDSTERNLEELIEKLPGITVDKDKGTIKVNGKEIKKIYIDGEEISGNNYQLITKNMPSDVVDKIQVLNNFNENMLLKNIGESNDIVLNLTVAKERKNTLFGNMQLGIGTNRNHDSYSNLFFLASKLKTLNFVGYNNIGKYSLANRLMDDVPFGTDEVNFNQLTPNQLRRINNTNLNNFSALNSQSIIRNDEFSVSNQFSSKPHRNLKINGGIFYLNDKNNLSIERNTTFRTNSTEFGLQESISYQKKPSTLDAHIGVDWQLNKTSAIYVAGTFFQNNVLNQNLTSSNINFFRDNNNQKLYRFGVILTYTKKINEHSAFLLSFLNETKSNTEDLFLSLKNSFVLPTVGQFKDSISQDLSQKIQFFNSKMTYLYSFEKGKIATGMGLSEKNEQLKSFLASPSSVSSSNDFLLKNQYIFSFFNFNYKFDFCDVFLNNEIGTFKVNTESNSRAVYYLPSIGLRKESMNHFFLLSYKANVTIPTIYDLTNQVILTGNRNFEIGANRENEVGRNNTFLLNYKYASFQDKFISNFTTNYSINTGGYLQDIRFSENYTLASRQRNIYTSKRLQISNGNEYYWDRLRVMLKVKPALYHMEYYNSINSVVGMYHLNVYSLDLTARSSFKKINYFGGVNLSRSNVINVSTNQLNSIRKRSIFLDLYFKSAHFNGRLQNELLFVERALTFDKYLTSNFLFNYVPKKKHFTISFTVRNLFGASNFINATNTEYYSDFQSVEIIPRYFMIGLNYNFGS